MLLTGFLMFSVSNCDYFTWERAFNKERQEIRQTGCGVVCRPKDFREVDRQAIPIVLISDGGKRFFPTKYQSTQTYTQYKLQLVANLAANCLSESNTIDIRVLEDDIKEPFTN